LKKGNISKLREHPEIFSTTFLFEKIKNTGGNDLWHSNNEKNWTIRSQIPKYDNASIWKRFRDYNGVGLRKLATFNDGLRYSPFSCENKRYAKGWA